MPPPAVRAASLLSDACGFLGLPVPSYLFSSPLSGGPSCLCFPTLCPPSRPQQTRLSCTCVPPSLLGSAWSTPRRGWSVRASRSRVPPSLFSACLSLSHAEPACCMWCSGTVAVGQGDSYHSRLGVAVRDAARCMFKSVSSLVSGCVFRPLSSDQDSMQGPQAIAFRRVHSGTPVLHGMWKTRAPGVQSTLGVATQGHGHHNQGSRPFHPWPVQEAHTCPLRRGTSLGFKITALRWDPAVEELLLILPPLNLPAPLC